MLMPLHHRWPALLDRCADCIRADAPFTIKESRRELNPVESAGDGSLTFSSGEDMTPLIGEKECDLRALEIVTRAVDD